VFQFIWEKSFIKAYKRVIKNNISLNEKINSTLKILQENPYADKLRTHKLHGMLSHLLSASIDYNYRIVFAIKIIDNIPSIVLIDIGTHEEVY